MHWTRVGWRVQLKTSIASRSFFQQTPHPLWATCRGVRPKHNENLPENPRSSSMLPPRNLAPSRFCQFRGWQLQLQRVVLLCFGTQQKPSCSFAPCLPDSGFHCTKGVSPQSLIQSLSCRDHGRVSNRYHTHDVQTDTGTCYALTSAKAITNLLYEGKLSHAVPNLL